MLCCCLMLDESVAGTTGSGNFGSIWRGDPMSKFLGTERGKAAVRDCTCHFRSLLKSQNFSLFRNGFFGTCDWPNGGRLQCDGISNYSIQFNLHTVGVLWGFI